MSILLKVSVFKSDWTGQSSTYWVIGCNVLIATLTIIVQVV